MKPSSRTEILAPAGSFETGIYAFKAGADAIYLGFSIFSARKGATNFSKDEYRKILKFARENNKKIYVTVNTIIKNSEISNLIKLFAFLELYTPDGIIIQDIGVLNVLQNYFPKLIIHASTQMSLHNQEAFTFSKINNIARVVLPRETTLDDVCNIIKNNPNLEIETFIHGALCNSFSGLCLASGLMLERSANRGECAQICRSYFVNEKGNQEFSFSCNDLFLGDNVLDLARAGVHSLKIEGRMKSPEYVFNVVKYYRAILDKYYGERIESSVIENAKSNLSFTFQRSITKGFLEHYKGINLTNNKYASHIGVLLGKIIHVEQSKNEYHVKLYSKLDLYDGIAVYRNKDITTAIKFSIKDFTKTLKSDIVVITLPSEIVLHKDEELYKVSSGKLHLPKINIDAYKSAKSNVEIICKINNSLIEIEIPNYKFSKNYEIECFEAQKKNLISEILQKTFSHSDKFDFEFTIKNVINNSSFASDSIFIKPSVLKTINNDLYLAIVSQFTNAIDLRFSDVYEQVFAEPLAFCNCENLDFQKIKNFVSKRQNLNIDDYQNFISSICFDSESLLITKFENCVFLSVSPLEDNLENLRSKIIKFACDNKKINIVVGINNFAHIEFAQKLSEVNNIFFYADFFLYIANRSTLSFLLRKLPSKVIFVYDWIESDFVNHKSLAVSERIIKINEDFNAPLFVSKICYKRHTINSGNCDKNCSRAFKFKLSNMEKEFLLIVKDCETFVFRS